MDEPKEGLEEPAGLPEKGADAADHFEELLRNARRLQRERGFSSKTGAEQGGDEPPVG
jgi:hypothetical protein